MLLLNLVNKMISVPKNKKLNLRSNKEFFDEMVTKCYKWARKNIKYEDWKPYAYLSQVGKAANNKLNVELETLDPNIRDVTVKFILHQYSTSEPLEENVEMFTILNKLTDNSKFSDEDIEKLKKWIPKNIDKKAFKFYKGMDHLEESQSMNSFKSFYITLLTGMNANDFFVKLLKEGKIDLKKYLESSKND
jgi:hypothetical protein